MRANVRFWCLADEMSRAAVVSHDREIESFSDGSAASSLHHRRMRRTWIIPDVERQGQPRGKDLSLKVPRLIANPPSDERVLSHPVVERLFARVLEGLSHSGPDAPQRKSGLRGD